MIVETDRTGTVDGLRNLISSVSHNSEVRSLLVLACDGNGFTADTVDEVLRDAPCPVFGGVFPEIIVGRAKLSVGTVVGGLACDVEPHVIPNLSDPTVDLDGVLEETLPSLSNAKTMFVFVDGYAKGILRLIEALYNSVGLDVNFVGGGAGSITPSGLDSTQSACLFTNHGMTKDAALLVAAETESGIGVAHGWTKLCGPYKVTETDGNTMKTLDWKPAFEVYKGIVEEHSGKEITAENFFDVAKSYPFGVSRLGTETIVRDPFTVLDDGALVLGTEVPQESFVDILTGDPASLIEAAKDALMSANENFVPTSSRRSVLFVDCISRVLFLGERFREEIDAVCSDGVPLVGALSIGEIANSGKDYLEMLNKTSVVCLLED